ncbi:hypothetical protein SLA2020_098950 [Shorea laevis]
MLFLACIFLIRVVIHLEKTKRCRYTVSEHKEDVAFIALVRALEIFMRNPNGTGNLCLGKRAREEQDAMNLLDAALALI